MGVKLFSAGDCTTNILGSGLPTCLKDMFGDLQGFDLFKKGVNFPVVNGVSTLDEASYTNLIKEQKLFPFNYIYNFEQTTPENERSTSSTGVLSTIRLGKPQYSVSFDKGTCNHKNLFDKRGSGRWDIGLKFDGVYLLFTNVQQSLLKGANVGLFDVDTFMLQAGTEPQMSRCMFQILDAQDFNTNMVPIPYETLGFNPLQINGAINLKLEVDPIASADEISFKAVSSCNVDDVIASLDDVANWNVAVNGITNVIASVNFNTNTNKYELTLTGTPLAATDVVVISTKSGATAVAEDTAGNLYKGSASAVVV